MIFFKEGVLLVNEYLKEIERIVKVIFFDFIRIEYLGDRMWWFCLCLFIFILIIVIFSVEMRLVFCEVFDFFIEFLVFGIYMMLYSLGLKSLYYFC